MDVLRSTSGVEAKAVRVKVLSSSLLDLFPMPSCYKTGSDGEGMQSVMDCYALENLGHIQSKLDWVLDGLASKPKRGRKRLGFLGLSRGTDARESEYILEVGSGHFSAPGVGLSSNFSPSVIEAVVETPARFPSGSPSKTDSLPEPSQVWQIDPVSTLVSPVVVYVPPEVVSKADFPAATEEAQAQTDRISSPVNGLVVVGTTMAKGQLEHSVEDDLEKMMDCYLRDGILIHGGVSRPGSSSKVDMLPDIAQGRQNTPVSIGSTVIAYSCLCYVGAVVGCHSIHPVRSSETSRATADMNFDGPSHHDPILVEGVFASGGRPDFASDPSKTLANSENEFEVVGLVMEPPVVPLAANPAQNPLVDRSSTLDLAGAKLPVLPI
ncbi:hypothetical protein FH972_012761 [Carpinus fangiana]|uniref:Uncharacterized protein n=1 Tax=Carpinus fangiana TaxID=176857 RepID=A0A5N6R500_9ROSI|nr:hypothetical protein FH972_012761 [Carpinus fangiana]